MQRQSKDLTLPIARLKDEVRKKYRQFKSGAVESDILLENRYKPIIKEINKTKRSEPPQVKREEALVEGNDGEEEEEEEEAADGFKPIVYSSPLDRGGRTFLHDESDDDEMDGAADEVSSALATDQGQLNATQWVNEKFKHELTKKYMLALFKDIGGRVKTIDHTYGPRYVKSSLMIGSENLTFEPDGGIVVGGTSFQPSAGLYELVFKRIPDKSVYTPKDLTVYRDVLVKSSAHKRNYDAKGPVNGNISFKYKNIIRELFDRKNKKGSGLNKLVNSRDLAYWDNPNELCDRLRLLVASAESGNTSHSNEILNITEELREAGYIKGRGNSRYLSLVR